MASSVRLPRSSGSMPRAATSSRIQPTPTPRNRRPPESWSIVAQRLASWSGWCSGRTRTPVPNRNRSVRAASQAIRSSGSGSSQSSGRGMRPVSLYG